MTAENSPNNEKDAVDDINEEQSAPQQKEAAQGPGSILREAREEQGLTQRDVADRLRLRLQIIELLEDDDYSTFSSPTFIKGYLRAYAKILEVPEDKVFAAYRQLGIKEPDSTAMQSFSRRVKHQESDNRLMLITYVVIIVVIGLVIWWWQDSDFTFDQLSEDVQQAVEQNTDNQAQQQPNRESVEAQPVAQQPTDSSSEQQPLLESEVQAEDASTALSANDPEAPAEDDPAESDPIEGDNVPTVSETEQADTTLGAVNEPSPQANETDDSEQGTMADQSGSDANDEPQTVTNAPETESELAEVNQPAVSESLTFEFSEECWVKVDDATGETQAVGIKPIGYTMPVPGEAPFSVTICKPSAVTITYQGETIDLSNFRQSRVARFTIPLSN